VVGDGDKVRKRFKGSKKLQEKLVQEEYDKAHEMLKQFDGVGAPVIKRDKDGTPYLEYDQLEKVKDLDKKEMEKAFKQVEEALKKMGKEMPDMRDNLYKDDKGNYVLKDLTHLRDAKPDNDEYRSTENKSRDLDKSLEDIEIQIEKKSRNWISWDTKELEAQRDELRSQKEEAERNLRELEEAEKNKDKEEEKPGTWVFTAVLQESFGGVFEKYGIEYVKQALVKDLYAINMLLITELTDSSEINLFYKVITEALGFEKGNNLGNKNKYSQLRNKYIGMYSPSRAKKIANTPIISDEIRIGLMSIFAEIDQRFPEYFSMPIKEMIDQYSKSNGSLKYTTNTIKILDSSLKNNNKYYRMLSR
jgi:hypothetical protein